MSRFDAIKFDDVSAEMSASIKSMFVAMEAVVGRMNPSRSQSLALTRLEEAHMWVNKAIRDEQLARERIATLDSYIEPDPEPCV